MLERCWMAHSLTPAVIEGRSFPLNWEKVGEFYDNNKLSVHVFWGGLKSELQSTDTDAESELLIFFFTGQVIKAWDIGVATMKTGEICQLICKPEYAYGAAGSPPKIPPNATLVFQVRPRHKK